MSLSELKARAVKQAAHKLPVRWQVAGKTCELRSCNERVLQLANTVFGRWQSPSHLIADSVLSSWQVEKHQFGQSESASPSQSSPLWQVRGPAGDVVGCASLADAIRRVEYAALCELYLANSPVTSLHAALLGHGGLGILIVGPCEAGKSTLATTLWRAGYELQGDDVALVAPNDGGLSAAPRRVALRQPSRQLLGNELWERLAATPSFMVTEEGCLFHPHELDGSPARACALEPALIVFLARRGVELAGAELRPLSPAELLVALAPYSNAVRTAGMGVALERLQPLAARAVGYDLGRGSLPSMLAAIEGLLPHLRCRG